MKFEEVAGWKSAQFSRPIWNQCYKRT